MSKLTRVKLDAEELKAGLAELTPLGEGATPSSVIGWRDRAGNLQRARADYPNGWRIEIFFTKPRSGKSSISSYRASFHINFTTQVRG